MLVIIKAEKVNNFLKHDNLKFCKLRLFVGFTKNCTTKGKEFLQKFFTVSVR